MIMGHRRSAKQGAHTYFAWLSAGQGQNVGAEVVRAHRHSRDLIWVCVMIGLGSCRSRVNDYSHSTVCAFHQVLH